VRFALPTLSEGEVHVWRADLDRAAVHLGRWTRNLCEDERRRAERFILERDRHRFVACRGILREILSGYLALPADRLRFRYGRHGKPCLADGSGPGRLRFNLSHSDALAVFAFTWNRHVGIDVERVRTDLRWDDVAAQCLSHGERQFLRRLGESQRCRAFLVAWTCKEAYLKARGEGLSFPVRRVELSFPPPVLQRVGEDREEPSRWTLRELRVGGDYVAALAVEGREWNLLCRPWSWRRGPFRAGDRLPTGAAIERGFCDAAAPTSGKHREVE
jgi:4'-phosphopantetheinyl transferase